MASRAAACDRVRQWAALAPDGGLSQIEQHLLESHVAGCAACRSFAEEVAGIAAALRAAPLEPVRIADVPAPARRPRRRPSSATFAGVTAALAATAASVLIAYGHVGRSSSVTATARPVIVVDATNGENQVQQTRFLQRLRNYAYTRSADNLAAARATRGPGAVAG
jgi:anti-sigma factor RsiW